MKSNNRLEQFLELQSKNMDIEKIAKEIGITAKTLRGFLNKNGYKIKDGKYILNTESNSAKDNQMSFEQIDTEKSAKKTNTRKIKSKDEKTKNILKTKKESSTSTSTSTKTNTKNKSKSEKKAKVTNVKKDKKINVTQEDLDKLCEVYDWYLQIKDFKAIKPKTASSKKDIIIEENETKELKTTSVRVNKKTWEDFERLCSNSSFNKQEILTQALKDFMKQYKNLL